MGIERIDNKTSVCIDDIEQLSFCKKIYTPNKLNQCDLVRNIHS